MFPSECHQTVHCLQKTYEVPFFGTLLPVCVHACAHKCLLVEVYGMLLKAAIYSGREGYGQEVDL